MSQGLRLHNESVITETRKQTCLILNPIVLTINQILLPPSSLTLQTFRTMLFTPMEFTSVKHQVSIAVPNFSPELWLVSVNHSAYVT